MSISEGASATSQGSVLGSSGGGGGGGSEAVPLALFHIGVVGAPGIGKSALANKFLLSGLSMQRSESPDVTATFGQQLVVPASSSAFARFAAVSPGSFPSPPSSLYSPSEQLPRTVRVDVTDFGNDSMISIEAAIEAVCDEKRSLHGLVVAFSFDSPASLDFAQQFIQRLKGAVRDKFCLLLVGTKGDASTVIDDADKAAVRVTGERAEYIAELLHVDFVPTSARLGQNVAAAFLNIVNAVEKVRSQSGTTIPRAPAPTDREKAAPKRQSGITKMWSGVKNRMVGTASSAKRTSFDSLDQVSGKLLDAGRAVATSVNNAVEVELKSKLKDATLSESPMQLPLKSDQWLKGEQASSVLLRPEDLVTDSKVVGRGGFAVIQRGTWMNVPVAVKMINNVPEFTREEEIDEFVREIRLLSKLRHPNVLTMFGFTIKEDVFCLVTEFIDGGDLTRYIYRGEGLFSEMFYESLQHRKRLASSIASGMMYLHAQQICHRDLKPGNLLVDNWERAVVKVCDFGLSSMMSDNSNATANVLSTPAFTAPELATPTHSFPVDVFSFAIALWEIDTAEHAWKEARRPFEIFSFVAEGRRPVINDRSPFAGLIQLCWHQSPESRPTFAEIVKHLAALDLPAEETVPFMGVLGAHFEVPAVRSSPTPETGSGGIRSPTSESASGGVRSTASGLDSQSATPNKDSNIEVHAKALDVAAETTSQRGASNVTAKPAESNSTSSASSTSMKHSTSMDSMRQTEITSTDNNNPLHLDDNNNAPPQHDIDFDRDLGAAMTHWIARNPGSPVTDFRARLRFLSGVSEADATIICDLITNRVRSADGTSWATLLSWFTPLHAGDRPEQEALSAHNRHWYFMSDVISILTRPDFHGFLDTNQARDRLLPQKQGTYLLRFSSSAGSLTLSARYGASVFHWRLTFKQPGSMALHLNNLVSYKNLDEVVKVHSTVLPLACNNDPATTFLLTQPCNRFAPPE